MISEVQVDNKASVKDENGKSPAWLELYNAGSAAVGLAVSCLRRMGSTRGGLAAARLAAHCTAVTAPCKPHAHVTASLHLQGYKLTTSPDGAPAWTFPSGVSLAPGAYLLVFVGGGGGGLGGAPLHAAGLKLLVEDGYLALLAPDGSTSCSLQYPE